MPECPTTHKAEQPLNDIPARIATAQWMLERQLGWIAGAEIKVGLVITLDIAMLGGIAATFSASPTKTAWAYLMVIVACSLALIGLACAAYAVNPRLDGPTRSLLYFGRIAETTEPDYVQAFNRTTDEQILEDWLVQVHRNAEIATVKHRWVKRAIYSSFLSTPPWVIAIALLSH